MRHKASWRLWGCEAQKFIFWLHNLSQIHTMLVGTNEIPVSLSLTSHHYGTPPSDPLDGLTKYSPTFTIRFNSELSAHGHWIMKNIWNDEWDTETTVYSVGKKRSTSHSLRCTMGRPLFMAIKVSWYHRSMLDSLFSSVYWRHWHMILYHNWSWNWKNVRGE